MIRQAKLKDIKQIMALIKLNADTFSRAEIIEAKKDIWKLITKRNKESNYFVRKISGEIVGCAGFSKQNDTSGVYFLNWLAIHPEHKRKGIATELCNYIEECIKKLDGRLIILNAGSGEANRYFYRKMGFSKAGKIPKYYNESKDLIWYYEPLQCSVNKKRYK